MFISQNLFSQALPEHINIGILRPASPALYLNEIATETLQEKCFSVAFHYQPKSKCASIAIFLTNWKYFVILFIRHRFWKNNFKM